MDENQRLADRFEEHRPRLRVMAYRMLGSFAEADDAVQDAWLRLSGSRSEEVENLGGWLTTVVARVCLNMLRSRHLREEPLGVNVPDPLISGEGSPQPEEQALLAESVGLALQIVLDTLTPGERLAFVLHDMFGVPFTEIAAMAGRTPGAVRQLASRARRRVKSAEIPADLDLARQREAVDAFFAAARGGDFEALVAALDPQVVLRIDTGAAAGSMLVRGADGVARQSLTGLAPALRAIELHPVLVNGAAGVIVTRRGRPVTIIGFTVAAGKIAEIDAIADPGRLQRLTAAIRDGATASPARTPKELADRSGYPGHRASSS
jgi:RNA polymerase sigma-70 factor (ECF subfamily)